jgi:predicted nucleic acid-binding protein
MDAAAWQKSRRLAVRCRDSGLTVPVADLIIAAVAIHHGIDIKHCDRPFDQILPLATKIN